MVSKAGQGTSKRLSSTVQWHPPRPGATRLTLPAIQRSFCSDPAPRRLHITTNPINKSGFRVTAYYSARQICLTPARPAHLSDICPPHLNPRVASFASPSACQPISLPAQSNSPAHPGSVGSPHDHRCPACPSPPAGGEKRDDSVGPPCRSN